ncbi:Arm DNA-binding domain-containing protein [Leeuwenhoekiella sp. W20_SRS_FM14]|uniref:Arm DNA-binding domain-containing protein n=1 Tax=Leeuwenhoekiella sp. W20_SRS_FM14 TaxID=3240270 RepID=UPI003F9C36F2
MPNFTTFSVLFFTRKLNRNKPELSIYARITVDGKCSEMSLKRKTSVNNWDPSKGRVRGTTAKAKNLNSNLDQYTPSCWMPIKSFWIKTHSLQQIESKLII